MNSAARTPSDLYVMAQAGMLPDARRSDGMVTVPIDQATFAEMQRDAEWSREELARLRAANEALTREVADLRSAARYMADTIFELETALGSARAARAAFIATEDARQAAAGLDG